MSPTLHEKPAHRVAARFLAAALERVSAFNMDMFARLSILEGAAGVQPGTWLRRGAKGFGDALEHFGPHLAASWTAPRSQGIYDKALAAASRVVSRNSTLDPADLVQDLLVNSSRSGGPDYTRLFYFVGKKLESHKNDIGAGDITPRDNKILGTVERWVRHYAINQLKKKQNQLTRTFAPGTAEGFDPTRTQPAPQLDESKRQLLMLLALQSPGGPGAELRRIIDRLVDRSFTKSEQPIVKVFLQKMSNPKYRSPARMREMVKKFTPEKWLTQAINLVRKEIMRELGVSSQHLTNVLGAKGRNIFRFMREKVGRDPAVKRILEELAQEIDLLEPGAVHLGTDHESELTEEQTPMQPFEVVQEWLHQSEQEDGEEEDDQTDEFLAILLSPQQELPDHAGDIFEMNEYLDWNTEVSPLSVYNRGAVPLRVARRFLLGNVGEVLDRGKAGHGDAPIRAISQYFADGGRNERGFGTRGGLSRRQLQQRRGKKQGHDDRSRYMLRELTRAALIHTGLRSDLMPLVRLGHEARVASHAIDLRGILIRTAYATENQELRRVLVQAIVAAERKGHSKQADRRGGPRYRPAFLRWVRNRKFRNEDTGNENVFASLPSRQQSQIYQEWQQSRLDWARGHAPEGLGPETRITLENFDQLRPGDVIWRSDSPVMLHRVTRVDREGWRAGNPTLTMVQFDRNNPSQEGEERHLTRSTVRNPMLEYHRVPGMGPRAERERARAQLPREPQGGWPKFDDIGVGNRRAERLQEAFKGMRDIRDPREVTPAKIKARLEDALGEAPPPRKAMKEFMHQLRDWVGQLAQAARDGGAPLQQQAQVYRAMKLKLDQGISQLDGDDRQERRDSQRRKRNLMPDMDRLPGGVLDRFDAAARGRMQPILGRAIQRLADGADFDADFANKLVKKLKDADVDMSYRNGAAAFGILRRSLEQVAQNVSGEDRQRLESAVQKAVNEGVRRIREGRGEDRQQEERQRRREEAPPRHQDRRELRGGGRKQMDAKAKLNSFFIGKVLPVGASDEIKAAAKEQLKQATYEDLERMRKAAAYILDNWDSDFAQNHALIKHLGYDREGLKKLKKLLKRKLGDVNGRRYHDDVLEIANKYDLESEDADALYDWRVDKPARGRALTDQEKFNRFMAKAKPETRERMRNMDLADFMVMYKSILKEVLDEDEEIPQAA